MSFFVGHGVSFRHDETRRRRLGRWAAGLV